MGLEVGKVTRGYLKSRMQMDRPERTVTFSIRLTEGQHAMLKFLAERFGDSKPAVAQRLLDAAMEDAMRSMGSLEVDREQSGVDSDEANRIIDRKVEGYRREIQRNFEEDLERVQ
jgi:hypothetical protein